jgi:hypothetical protein
MKFKEKNIVETQYILSHIFVQLTSLPSKCNRLLLGWLKLGCSISKKNDIRLTGKARMGKIDIFFWAPSAVVLKYFLAPPLNAKNI